MRRTVAGMLLPDDEIDAELERRPRWRREGGMLRRDDTCADFAQAAQWVEAVADVAEDHHHHPDVDIRWNRVTLWLTTRSKGGLTQKDLDLAADIDALPGPNVA